MAWLEDQNQKISDLIDWIEEQKALMALFPIDPYLIEVSDSDIGHPLEGKEDLAEYQECAKALGLLEVS